MVLEVRLIFTGFFFQYLRQRKELSEDLGFVVRVSKRHTLACGEYKLPQTTLHIAPAVMHIEKGHIICRRQ